jgi:excinuclease UvrABC nuclease subunit
MQFVFHEIDYDNSSFVEAVLPSVPKHSGIYKISDVRGKLIVLDKSSNLHGRLERFFGERSEMLRDLDLREITGRIEYLRTDSTFETLYALYLERRRLFPKTYRKLRTFRLFPLMKINRKQRFPRIYHSRQIKAGVDYFGPFVTRGQFSRLKTALERTFKLRPCLYNIRGNDPHPDCMYFQMHTCSRPCNNDIDRRAYLEDVTQAVAFLEGRDAAIDSTLVERMRALSSDTKFEEAEVLRRRLEKIQRARRETTDTFFSLWNFNYVVILPADSVARRRVAFVREGSIVDFVQYEVASMTEQFDNDLRRVFLTAAPGVSREHQYDEFCLVCNFLVNPLQTVELVPVRDVDKLAVAVVTRIQQKRRKPKNSVPAV